MAVILAFFIITVGVARSQLLVCHYQCEQDRQVNVAPCCNSGAGTHHADGQQETGPDRDCPHVDSSQNFSDFSFTTPFTKVSAPAASFAGGALPTALLPPAAAERVNTLPTGTSPLGIVTPPRYHLYCSLLI